jgi:hypothetical protein
MSYFERPQRTVPIIARIIPIMVIRKFRTPLISLYKRPRKNATELGPQPAIGNVTA